MFFQQDYQTYVLRKAKKREVLVTSLTEYHQQELREIETQRELLIKDYEEKKTSTYMYMHYVCLVVVRAEPDPTLETREKGQGRLASTTCVSATIVAGQSDCRI